MVRCKNNRKKIFDKLVFGNVLWVSMIFVGLALVSINGQCFAQDMDCEENQLSSNYCASFAFNKVDGEMNRSYQKQMSYLSSPYYKGALKRAQIAWIEFRDRDCDYQRGAIEQRGSMDQMIFFECMYKHTKVRLEELKGYLSCRQNGCPY